MVEMKAARPPASALLWFRIAVVYFVGAAVIGIVMGARGDFSLVSVHAHMNLLGWEALALMGLIYHHLPKLGNNLLARTHFWLHNIALPVLMLALVAREWGNPRMEPLIAGTSSVIGAAILIFAVNILIKGKKCDLQ